MKFATLLVIAAVVGAVALATNVQQPHIHGSMKAMFQAWMKKVGRVYVSAAEEEKHFHTFVANYERLAQQGPLPLAKQNRFMDMTYAEFVKKFAVKRPVRAASHPDFEKILPTPNSPHIEIGNYTKPDGSTGTTYKWKYVTPIKWQGYDCGSCWAFATTASIEGKWGAKKYAQPSSLSPQELVSCYAGNCDAQDATAAAKWLIKKKLVTLSLYPYVSGDGDVPKCTTPTSPAAANYVTLTSTAWQNPSSWATTLVSKGPMAMSIYMCPSFQNYAGGVYNCDCASNDDYHIMSLYGYTDTYWIIKNSWDTDWGDNGWLYLKRGVNACDSGPGGLQSYVL